MRPTQDDFARVFDPLERFRLRLNELSQDGPAQDSRAARDSRTKLGGMAWVLALTAYGIGVDHLLSWRLLRLSAGWQPAFGHWTLIRSGIEGTAMARWLCDPAISASERIRRAAGVELEGYEERDKFERHMGPRLPKPTGKARTAAQRIAALKQRLGPIKPATTTATQLFAKYAVAEDDDLAGEALFRPVSGIAHAMVWSVFRLSSLDGAIRHPDGRLAARVSADEGSVLRATAIAMRVAKDALADIDWYAAPQP